MTISYAFLLPALLASHALAEKQYALEESSTIVRGKQEPLQWTPHAVTVITDEEIGVTYAGYRLYSDYPTNSRLPVANVFNWTSWDLSLDYVWRDWTIRIFSQNVKDKQHLQNVRTITQADVLAQDVVTNDLAPLITYAEYRLPRYGGVEIIFKPDIKSLIKKPNFGALKPTFLRKIPLINKIPLIRK